MSSLTPIKMAQREVQRLVTQNKTWSPAMERIDIDMIAAGVRTPFEMWRYMVARGPTDAKLITLKMRCART